MRIFLFLLLIASTSLLAQEKRRMFFSTSINSTSKPTPAATQSPTPAATPDNTDPSTTLSRFFDALKADQLDTAYTDLVKNTVISARPENVQKLKEKTREALDNFGPIKGYDVVENLEIGQSLSRITCLSLNEDLPLRWRFYFYKADSQWRLVDLRVDDGLVELFEEVARKGKK